MKKPALICLGLLLTLATSVSAGPPPGRGDGGLGRSPRVAPLFMRSLVQPDTIMRNQARLELSEEQRETIQKALGETRSSMEESRWELAGHKESIRRVLDQSPIDADKALEATAELFRLETAIKTRRSPIFQSHRHWLRSSLRTYAKAYGPWAITRKHENMKFRL